MSKRNTRSKTRADGASSPKNPSEQQESHEPPAADLPGLFPVHDGSYGVNTLINVDNLKRRRGRKPKSGPVNEDDEDRQFDRRMKGKDGKRFSMNNNLRKVVEEAVDEAENNDDVIPDEPEDLREPEIQQPETQQPGTQQPEAKQDKTPWPDQETDPVNQDPEQDIQPGTQPGTRTSPQPSTQPGTGTNPQPGTWPGTGTTPQLGTWPGTGTTTQPGTWPGTGTTTQPGTWPGTGTTTQPGTWPDTGTNKQPGTGPDFQRPGQKQPQQTQRPKPPEPSRYPDRRLDGPRRLSPIDGDSGGPDPPFDDSWGAGNPSIVTLGRLFGNEDDGLHLPFKTVDYRPSDPYALIHNRYPSAPPSSTRSAPFYGIPLGQGSRLPKSPLRPSTSRSFLTESSLFGRAEVNTPNRKSNRAGSEPAPDSTSRPVRDANANRETQWPQIPDPSVTQPGDVEYPALPLGRQGEVLPTPSTDTNSSNLTPEDWRLVNNLINDMQIPPRARSSGAPPRPIQNLDQLTFEELQAAKIMIQDMGNNPASVARIVAELDKAASRPGARSSSRLITLSPPKDTGPSPGVTPQDQASITDARSGNLSPEDWRSVNALIRDMRIPPRARSSGEPPRPIQNLDHLTIEELQAARAMIQDMGNDPASVARIVAELDKAASRPGVRSSSRVKTLFPRESTPKDIGPSPEVTPHDQTSIADARSSNLTANQWKSVRNLINDMRIPPRAQPSNIPPPPIGNLDHLTIEELQAARTMIQDMGNDPASVARVVAELDKAASRPGVRSSSKVTTLFPRESGRTNTGPPPGVTLQDLTSTDYPLATGDRRSTNLTLPTAEVPDDADDEDEDEDESPTSQEEQFLASRRKEKPAKPANKKTVGSTERKYGSPFGRRIGQALRTCLIIVAILYTAWYTVQGVSYLLTRGSSVQNDVFPQDNTPWINWSAITGGIGRMIPSGFGSSTGAGNKSSDLQTTIEDLDQKLPDKVHVEKDKKGILKIPQEFWHALRDLARGDDAKRSLEDAQKYIPGMTEAEWIDFRSGMRGALPKDGGLSVVEKECCVKAWNNWLQQNKDKIDKTMGGATLSKEEFVNLFNQEIKTYQQDIQRELAAQETRIKELADTVEQLCKPPVDEEQDAVTEKSVRSICDDIVKRAISAAKLDAVATGRIRGHATDVLANQVNFFGVGSGAVIDPQYNSLPWRFPKDYFPFRSKKWHQRDGYVPQPALSALSPWSEEGECFCAGPSVTGMIVNTNTIHVLTSRHIVPQHLVIEHILPGSTLDPGSRPKDIEVWMKFEEVTLRSEASAFSAKQFPETPKEKTLNEAWVKVGHFTFQDRNSGDTFQVFKLSDELGRMSASSNGFVIRAVSNYGADHTCFYRLRLYGEVDQSVKEWIDEEGDEK